MSEDTPRYPVLVVETSPDAVDVLIGRLTLLGAEGIEERDGTTLTRGGAKGVTLRASFTDEAAASEALADVQADHDARIEYVVGDDWNDAWKAHWRPTRLTPRVVVVPSWMTYDPEPGDLVMSLDPGRAFGTGQHPSTALAARAIERRIAKGEHPLVIDLGCGSGILSFVALMEGVPRAVACDIDPESVSYAQEGADALGLASRVDLRAGGVDVVTETSTLVVANIEAAVLIPLAAEVAAKVAPGGALILSGVLVEQKDAVIAAYRAQGLTPDGAEVEGEWVAPEFVRA